MSNLILKPCPFCGKKEPYAENCICQSDPMLAMSRGAWNTRPIEDKLTARVAELEEALRTLKTKYWVNEDVMEFIDRILK